MIRRVLFYFLLVFLVVWLSVSYYVRHRVGSFINSLNSDNLKITYADLEIYNFPFWWKIKIIEPRVSTIDDSGSKEMDFRFLDISFSPALKDIEINAGASFSVKQSSPEGERDYSLESGENSVIKVSFSESLFFLSGKEKIGKNLKSLEYSLENISAKERGEELFRVDGLNFTIHREKEGLRIKLKSDYRGKENFASFLSAKADLDFSLSEETSGKKYSTDNFSIVLDDSSLFLSGSLLSPKGEAPEGKFSVNIKNYDSFLEKAAPEDFIISKLYFKKFISNIAKNIKGRLPEGNVKFDVEFSGEGIKIDSIDLFNFKKAK